MPIFHLRRTVQCRIAFLLLAMLTYGVGFNVLPEKLVTSIDLFMLSGFTVLYFIILPAAYWRWIIVQGGQKSWKLLMVLSLSLLMARLSFPTDIAVYFEFITWLRYPIILVLLLIESFLIISIIKGLWQARGAKGDPRLAIVEQYGAKVSDSHAQHQQANHTDDKKLGIGLILATEPASWYYAIPYFSRHHPSAITSIISSNAKRSRLVLYGAGVVLLSVISFVLLEKINHLIALIISSLCMYCLVLIVANYRICRHYAIYLKDESLIINNGILGFISVNVAEIKEINTCLGITKLSNSDTDIITLGRGDNVNVRLLFKSLQVYYGAMGQLPEQVSAIQLAVTSAQTLREKLAETLAKASE